MNHRKGTLFALTTAFLWGVWAIGIKAVLEEVDSITVVWMRMTVAAICLAVFFAFKQPQAFHVFSKPPKMIWLAAIGLSLNYIGFTKGIDLSGAATAQVIIQVGPILLCLAWFFVFKERNSSKQMIGFIIAFIGLFFFYQKQISSMDTGQDHFIKGALATLGGAISWSAYSITQKSIVKTYPVQYINLFIYTFASIAYTPFMDFSIFNNLPTWAWITLISLGFNTVAAYWCMGKALKYTDASRVSIIAILNPVLTFILLELMQICNINWFEHTTISFLAYVGAGLMMLGATLATITPKETTKNIKI